MQEERSMYDLIQEALAKPQEFSTRNKIQRMRDFYNGHPEVAQEVHSQFALGESDPSLDITYNVIQTLDTASRANSNSLIDFTPSQLFGYGKRALNERLAQFNQKVIRCRVETLELTHQPSAESE